MCFITVGTYNPEKKETLTSKVRSARTVAMANEILNGDTSIAQGLRMLRSHASKRPMFGEFVIPSWAKYTKQ
jgi:hypothetical protein